MTDASAGWRQEYAFAGISVPSACQYPTCGREDELELVIIGEAVVRTCRRHAKDLLGVSS